MKKRMFAYLMTLCMTVTMFSGTALAEEKEPTTECVCTTLCTEDSVNDLCDVCKNDIADCVGGVENTEEPVEPTEEQTEENKQEEENVETQEENIEDETEFVEETEEENVTVDNQEDAPEDEEQVANEVTESAVTLVQGEKLIGNYDTINEALENIEEYDYKNNKEKYTLTLNSDINEDVVIPEIKLYVDIDLNGFKLTNVDDHTITNHSTTKGTKHPSIIDSKGGGIVDNVTHGKAAVYNDINSYIKLDGGTYTRSQESSSGGADDSVSGGNSWYVIKNFGTMYIENGVTVKFSDSNEGYYSSLIGNGWQDAAKAEEGKGSEPNPNDKTGKVLLTINGGEFIGGQITIKNDDYGELIITDGKFTQPSEGRSAVANNNIATISGGTFTSEDGAVLYSRHYASDFNDGTITIQGGEFISNSGNAVELQTGGAKAVITGGTFTSGSGKYAVYAEDGANAEISSGTFYVDDASLVANRDDMFVSGKAPSEGADGSFEVDYTAPGAIVTDRDGNTKKYATFKEAVKAAPAGSTVTLTDDVVLGELGAETSNFNVTIDMNGHNIDGTAVTKYNGRVLYMHTSYGAKPIEGEESFLRIMNSQTDGGKIIGKLPIEASCGDSRYKLPIIIDENVELITTEDGTDAVILDSSAYLIYNESTKDYVKNGGFKVTADDNSERIYGNLANGAADAANGSIIYMLHDYVGNENIKSGGNSSILDLDGHTYTYTGNDQIVDVNHKDTEFTIKNGYLTTTADKLNQGGITVLYNNSSITLDKVQMDVPGDSYGIVTNGMNVNNGVTLRNSTLNVHDGLGIYFPSSGSVTIDNSVINAKHTGVQICAGDLTITGDNTAITVTGNTEEKTEGDGPIIDGAAISIIERTGYKGIGTVTIEGGTFTSAGIDQNGEKIPAVKAYSFNNTDKEQEWAEAGNSVTISGGNYSKVPENMNALCADGYVPSVEEDGSSTVKPGVDANFAAQVGNRKYKTLEEAINAVGKGGTITLLRNVEEKGIFLPAGDKNFTIDFNNNKFTATELVGSKNTESQAMHLEKGNTVVMKNGTITVKPELYGNTAMLIQNYCNLTLENMILDGTVLDHPNKPLYALSNNCGNTVLKGNTVISAKDGDFAFDVCWAASYTDGARVTMEDGVKINGDVQLGLWDKDAYEGTQSVLTVNGGTITGGLDIMSTKEDPDKVIETLKPNVTINGGSFGESVDEYLDESDKANAKIEKANGMNAYYTDINEAVKDAKEDDIVVDLTDKKDPETKYYTVTLDYNDDETAKLVLSVKDGDTFTVPEDPSQSGYKFLYWLGSDDEKYYEDDEITVEEDITLKAKWEKKSNGSSFELEETESSGDYVVRVDEGKHGEVTVSPKRADKGDTIKITVEPEEGYEIDKIKAFDEDDEEIKLTEKADNKFTFKMPASDVDVEVSFKEKENKEEDKHVMPFIDVPANIWYRNAVQYVYENGIMSGTSDITFSPDMATTRGMIVTILYRLEGMPKTGTANGFTDVPVGAYYEDAVAWASANNIVSGYGNGLFGPEDKVTREQMAVIIYNYHKAMGKDVSNIEGMRIYEFTDYESISDWAVTAVRYCLNAGIFNGNADGTLNPKGNVTRAELAVIINNLA